MLSNPFRDQDSSITKPEYPTKDAQQGPFSYGASRFHINYIFREDGDSLRRLLFPELFEGKHGTHEYNPVVDTPWVEAQLQYYGIHFNSGIDGFKAKALLLTSVAYGLVCTYSPLQIIYC